MPSLTIAEAEEIRISDAIEALNNGEFTTTAEAAREHKVSYQKLRARRLRRAPKSATGGQNKTLSEAQEAALCLYMDRCIALGRPAKKKHIRAAANSILRGDGIQKQVSQWWTKRFLKRHPIYHKRKTKSLSAERQAAQQQEDIQRHFRDFEKTVIQYNIQLEDIHNFDESRFRIGCLRGQVVWTYADIRAVYISDPDNRELVTLMECISRVGKVIKPMIVMSGIVFKEQHFDNDLDDDVLFGISESRYTNDRLSFEWIKHFDKQTKDSKKGKYKLLIIDGHGSYLTYEFVNYCWDYDIIPFLLPAHTTHLLQPLNIGVFQSYKH